MSDSKPPDRWRCVYCRRVWRREKCAVRFGGLECPHCLSLAYVGLLRPLAGGAAPEDER